VVIFLEGLVVVLWYGVIVGGACCGVVGVLGVVVCGVHTSRGCLSALL